MPRKSKVIAVSLDKGVEEEKPKTEAEQMTALVNEVKAEEPTVEMIGEPVLPISEEDEKLVVVKKTRAKRGTSKEPVKESVPEATPTKKPRAKRASRTPPPVETVSVPEVPVVESVSVPEASVSKAKEKVACPGCGKEMSAKTLKYNHVHSCRASKGADANPEPNAQTIPEEVIEQEVQKRIQNNRKAKLDQRRQAFESLIVNAF